MLMEVLFQIFFHLEMRFQIVIGSQNNLVPTCENKFKLNEELKEMRVTKIDWIRMREDK